MENLREKAVKAYEAIFSVKKLLKSVKPHIFSKRSLGQNYFYSRLKDIHS